MRIIVCYVAVCGGAKTDDFAARFVGSYLANPPGVEHSTIVICNGGTLTRDQELLFLPMNPHFHPRSNHGWDLGGYLDVARQFECDMLVCCGESIHFHRPGWLARLAEAWTAHGPGMYGAFTSNLVRPHINTTGFAVAPSLLKGCAVPMNREERYEFEHGRNAFWRRVQSLGRPTKLVTFDGGCWDPPHWRLPPNILWKGDQSNCLAWCSHTERFAQADEKTKRFWESNANRGFAT